MSSPSPLEVIVADLRRRPGSARQFHASVELAGLATSTAAVPGGGLVEVDVELESLSNAIVASGMLRAPWTGVCRRCLGEVEGIVEVDVREIFEVSPTEGETYELGHDTVDLEPMVRDQVILALPLAPLCGTGCAGPAPERFPTGPFDDGDNDDTDDDAESDASTSRRFSGVDPRWAALDQIRFDD